MPTRAPRMHAARYACLDACCLAQVYLRGLPRQLSSEELRAERVGFQVHPQPWFRSADDRTLCWYKMASTLDGHSSTPSACPASSRAQSMLAAQDRSLGRPEAAGGTLPPVSERAQGFSLWTNAVSGPPYIVHSQLEARPRTRSNESLGRGTASSMRREMSGDSSARAK